VFELVSETRVRVPPKLRVSWQAQKHEVSKPSGYLLNFVDVVEWLLALQPSSINSASHEGRTCLHLAAAQGYLEMVILLCTKGCFINPLMLYKGNLYTPLDLARRKNHQVVVDYLTKKHEAKDSSEIPEEEREKNRQTFEEQLVQAKLNRGHYLQDEDEDNDDLMSKSKSRRRRSFEGCRSKRHVTSTGVNTTARRVSSAGAVGVLAKTTSTTDLATARPVSKSSERIERIVREEIQKFVMTKQNSDTELTNKKADNEVNLLLTSPGEVHPDGTEQPPTFAFPDIDEEFEDLPAISDSSDESSDDEKQKENLSSHSDKRKAYNTDRMMKLKEIKPESTASTNYNEKLMRDENNSVLKKQKANVLEINILDKIVFYSLINTSTSFVTSNHHASTRSHQLPDVGPDDVEVYEDDWEEMGSNRPIDTLSDQLKLIYMEERARLSRASVAAPNRTIANDRFETRVRRAQAVPLVNERVQRLNKVYGSGTMTSGKTAIRKKVINVDGGNGRRCECLGKHLLIKQDS
ncbi:ankyrin repeat protein, partial [Dictyocaulus viviparus]